MCQTVHKQYRGWDITIRCSDRAGAGNLNQAIAFTAMAEAELQPSENPNEWVDPRLQLISTGNRSFQSGGGCIDELFSEVKQLIDALRK